jgi:UDP-N-acetylglucosamine:LPS N-acetylglucosamine transferase
MSRSGYTTVMELAFLQKKSILVPTPGQTEQEYLARRLAQDHFCLAASQDHFDFDYLFEQAKTYNYQQASFPVFEGAQIAKLLELSLSQQS